MAIEPFSYWRTGSIPLALGENWVSVTATDEHGHATQRVILSFRSAESEAAVWGSREIDGRVVPYRVVDGLAVAFGD